jgi:hypothetical protein
MIVKISRSAGANVETPPPRPFLPSNRWRQCARAKRSAYSMKSGDLEGFQLVEYMNCSCTPVRSTNSRDSLATLTVKSRGCLLVMRSDKNKRAGTARSLAFRRPTPIFLNAGPTRWPRLPINAEAFFRLGCYLLVSARCRWIYILAMEALYHVTNKSRCLAYDKSTLVERRPSTRKIICTRNQFWPLSTNIFTSPVLCPNWICQRGQSGG